jgi:hypothetical protein
MMARSTDWAGDCRLSTKAAVREALATEIRGLRPPDSASVANPDCRFAPPAFLIGAGAPWAPRGARAMAAEPEANLALPCATSGHVARGVANDEAEGGGVDPRLFRRAPGVPTPVSHQGCSVDMAAETTTGNPSAGIWETIGHRNGRLGRASSSARLIAHRAEDVLVAGRGVPHRGVDALVPGGALDEAEVLGPPVQVREAGMPERVEVEGAVESGALLPKTEEVAQGPGGDPRSPARDEQRAVGTEVLAAGLLPPHELGELVPERVGQEDLLGSGVVAGPFEDAQRDAPPDSPVRMQDVADVQGGDLELPQPSSKGESEDNVITEPVPALPCDLQDPSLLDLGERSGRADDSGGVGGHGDSPRKGPPDTDALSAEQGKAKGAGPLIVVKRDERDLLDWLGTELGFLTGVGHYNEEPLAFEPYQVAFLRSTRKYRWVEKGRQVGFSFLFACEAIARCHLREAHTSVMVSYNLEDAKEKVNYARQISEELPLAFRKKLITDSKTELGFLSNGASKRVSRIISNPSKAPRGKKGDLYLDELAHYANDREVYKGSTALILRSRGQLTGCSSPLGRRGVFWEIARQELRPYRAYWRQNVPWWLCRFFCTDVPRASKDAPMMATEERVRTFGTKDIQDQLDSLLLEDFQQEFELAYCDESYSFFPYELILPCTSDDLVLADDFPALAEIEGRLVAGFDVGRKRDLSELAIFEEVAGKKECRLLRSYDRVPFAEQEADLRRMLSILPIARLSIDQNGLGMHLAENLRRDFAQVMPETFSNESKEVWANDFKILLQRKDIVLPKDRELVAQTHSVKRRLTPTGKPSFEVERDEVGRGHADRFWAVALACRKERGPMSGAVAEISVRILG